MAAFPNTAYSQDSQIEAMPNIALARAEDGSIRGRMLRSNETYDVRLVHNNLTETDANTIEDFYETDPTRQVEVTWRSVTYNCRWVSKPVIEHFQGDRWTAVSTLMGVRVDGA